MRKSPILFVSLIFIFFGCSPDSDFKELTKEEIDSAAFEKSNTPISAFLDNGYIKEKNEGKIEIRFNDYNQAFSNIALISFFEGDYIGLISGLPTFDTGWKYLLWPTYSDIVILRKENLEIVFEKRIYESVSDMSLHNDSVYIEYGDYPNLEYGRFPFSKD